MIDVCKFLPFVSPLLCTPQSILTPFEKSPHRCLPFVMADPADAEVKHPEHGGAASASLTLTQDGGLYKIGTWLFENEVTIR